MKQILITIACLALSSTALASENNVYILNADQENDLTVAYQQCKLMVVKPQNYFNCRPATTTTIQTKAHGGIGYTIINVGNNDVINLISAQFSNQAQPYDFAPASSPSNAPASPAISQIVPKTMKFSACSSFAENNGSNPEALVINSYNVADKAFCSSVRS